jgi:hypothetical protein
MNTTETQSLAEETEFQTAIQPIILELFEEWQHYQRSGDTKAVGFAEWRKIKIEEFFL